MRLRPSSAKYDVSAGVLNVTLSEDLAAHDSTKIVLYDSTKSGNVTFAANAFSEVADGILSVTLSGNTKSGFEDLNHSRCRDTGRRSDRCGATPMRRS